MRGLDPEDLSIPVFLGRFHTERPDANGNFTGDACWQLHRTTPVGVVISDLGVSTSNLRHLEARDDGPTLSKVTLV